MQLSRINSFLEAQAASRQCLSKGVNNVKEPVDSTRALTDFEIFGPKYAKIRHLKRCKYF